MAESGPPRVAALLLNWRRADLTLRCLADLLAVPAPAMTVVVIDNGSGDAETAALRTGIANALRTRPGRHCVELLALPDNRGFTGGMNAGFQRAHALGSDYALVLNNDLQLGPDFLQPLVAVLDTDASVAAVGPTVLHPDGTVWAQGGRTAFVPNGLVLGDHGQQPAPTTSGPEPVGFLPGACVLFRTAQVHELGGFDDRYFMLGRRRPLRAAAGALRLDRLAAVGARRTRRWPVVGRRALAVAQVLMACNAVRYLKANGTPRAWFAWFLCDVLGWPLILPKGVRPAWAKLCGTVAGVLGHRAGPADVARWLKP